MVLSTWALHGPLLNHQNVLPAQHGSLILDFPTVIRITLKAYPNVKNRAPTPAGKHYFNVKCWCAMFNLNAILCISHDKYNVFCPRAMSLGIAPLERTTHIRRDVWQKYDPQLRDQSVW